MITPFYQDSHVIIYHGDSRIILPQLESNSIQCCVTSPPYYSLRDYGGGQWRGGDEGCDHRAPSRFDYPLNAGLGSTGKQTQASNAGSNGTTQYKGTCGKCGATRHDQQIGLEQTPAAYVAEMTGVFEQVRRVLRDDGTLWLNLGDSYAGSTGNQTITPQTAYRTGRASGEPYAPAKKTLEYEARPAGYKDYGSLKPKDLIGIPWRVAFALQDAGWWLRSDIIWAKGNPMPESVTDRPTKAHEYLFLMAKAATYYYDQEAIREACSETSHGSPNIIPGWKRAALGAAGGSTTLGKWTAEDKATGRNKRSVWQVNTTGFPGAHFAVFPEKLIEPCILAGAPERSCAACGAPWGRVVERTGYNGAGRADTTVYTGQAYQSPQSAPRGPKRNFGEPVSTTLGWQPSCQCAAATVPGVVLDPFGGSGTVGVVAKRFGRRAILIEQNIEYCRMAAARIEATPTPFQFDAYEPDEPDEAEPAQPEQVALW